MGLSSNRVINAETQSGPAVATNALTKSESAEQTWYWCAPNHRSAHAEAFACQTPATRHCTNAGHLRTIGMCPGCSGPTFAPPLCQTSTFIVAGRRRTQTQPPAAHQPQIWCGVWRRRCWQNEPTATCQFMWGQSQGPRWPTDGGLAGYGASPTHPLTVDRPMHG